MLINPEMIEWEGCSCMDRKIKDVKKKMDKGMNSLLKADKKLDKKLEASEKMARKKK